MAKSEDLKRIEEALLARLGTKAQRAIESLRADASQRERGDVIIMVRS